MVTYESQDSVGGDLPLPLGGGHVAAPGNPAPAFDVFVNDLTLNLHINKDHPYQRQTADAQKQQFDTAPEAGEHSLSNWWIRSQMSFHGGAGIRFLDTEHSDTSQNSTVRLRYETSRGIDVWTRGEIRRLPDTALLSPTSGQTWTFATQLNGESYLIYAFGTTIRAQRTVAGDTIDYAVTGMAGSIKSMVIDGSKYYVATTDGHIFVGPLDNSVPGVSAWNFVSSSDVTLGWVKDRLMAGINNSVYELAGTGPALPAPLYTHPSPDWRWTCWAEAPQAVIAAGHNGLQSTIYSFTLSDPLGVPQLMPGVSIAMMPVGEVINCLYFYVGSQLAIGTTQGLRMGAFDSFYGTFKYGPLSFPSRIEDAVTVTALHGRGTFVYAGTVIDGEASLVRLDLGTQTDQGIYAWAPDLRCPAAVNSTIDSIAVDSQGRLRFGVRNYGLVGEVPTYVGRDAWLRTGKIRYDTVDPKHYKYGQLHTEQAGSLAVSAQSSVAPLKLVYTQTDTTGGTERFRLIDGAAEWLQLTFDLTGTAKMTSYQILSVPASKRQRLIALPCQVFDHEKNRHGTPVGYTGRAKDILDTLEALEANGDEVTVQCPVLGIDAVRCTVERIEFTQATFAAPGKGFGLGGYANLIFRTTA